MRLKWFEEHMNERAGSDEQAPGRNPREIAEISDDALDDETMALLVDDYFVFQKSFAEFLGVGESTVAGWVKNKQFPDYAKRATLAAYCADKHFDAAQAAQQDGKRPKVVKDGERYLIVKFDTDEAGVSLGRVIARDLPNEKTALVLSSSLRAWELLRSAERLIDNEIELQDVGDSHWIKILKDEITTERQRTFAHDKYLERIMKLRQLDAERAAKNAECAAKYANLTIDEILADLDLGAAPENAKVVNASNKEVGE